MKQDIKKFRVTIQMRDLLKRVGQVSWDSNQFEQKHRFELLEKNDEDEYMKTLIYYLMQVRIVGKEFEELAKGEASEFLDEINMNLINNENKDNPTRFWDDEFVVNLSPIAKSIYMYLLTSQYINLCAIFQLPVKKILFETGWSMEQFEVARKELEGGKVMLFKDGWVYMTKARKNNKFEASRDTAIAMVNELAKVPKDLIVSFNEFCEYPEIVVPPLDESRGGSTGTSGGGSTQNTKYKKQKVKEETLKQTKEYLTNLLHWS